MNKQIPSTSFMGENFLLETKAARMLYHQHAADIPIIDYHCHLNPKLIAENYQFKTIGELWLDGDHYKWRLMRANGVPERYITGNQTSPREKFQYWAEALSKAIGNPLYHWTHLELQRYFGYHGVFSPETAQEVWDLCNEKLSHPEMSAREIVRRSNVKILITTDDPTDTLEYHKALSQDDTWDVSVLPCWRPDKVIQLDSEEFPRYIETLGRVTQTPITSLCQLEEALIKRMDFFAAHGCCISDHGLDKAYSTSITQERGNEIFVKALGKKPLTTEDVDGYKTYILTFLASQYAKREWVMQLHFAAARNINTKAFNQLGPDTGYDSIGKNIDIHHLLTFLDILEQKNALPKTILYSLNPNDEPVLASVLNAFQATDIKSKMQLGAPWWFNDTKSNMEQGLITLANATLLGNFIGMLTDSRSFTAYPRHEYFRRILCNLLGKWWENGEIPQDSALVGKLVSDICYNNANTYFGFL